MKKNALAFVSCLLISICSNAQSWTKLGNNLNAGDAIADMCIDPSGNVYVGGWFYNASFDYYIAKWNGATWSQLGTGTNALNNTNGSITCMCTDAAGNIYIAPIYSTSGGYYNVKKWNGSTWTQLGALNANDDIQAIVSDPAGNIYVAGSFTNGPNNFTGQKYVAKWDGVTWTQVGTGTNALNPNGFIQNLYIDLAGNLYAGGFFTNASGKYYVAKWDGTTWSELGTGVNALKANWEITAIVSDAQGNIYASGGFTNGTSSANGSKYVAKWNGSSWAELGTGSNALNANNDIDHLLIDASGNILASGWFTNSSNKYYVAKWNGSNWSELGGTNTLNANSGINAMRFDNAGNLYTAGNFSDNSGLRYVARFGMPFVDSINVHTLNNVTASINTNGGTLQLVADVYPATANQNVTWSINSSVVATISATGLVTALTNGSIWAIATSIQNASMKDSLEIFITGQIIPIDSIKVHTTNNVPAAINTAHGSLQLTSKIYPLTANQNVTWSIMPAGLAGISATGIVTATANGAVWAKAIAAQDSTKIDSLRITISGQEEPNGINEIAYANGFKIYPNPANNKLFLETNNPNAKATVYIYDLTGNLKYSEPIKGDHSVFDLKKLPSGAYILKYKNETVEIKATFTKE